MGNQSQVVNFSFIQANTAGVFMEALTQDLVSLGFKAFGVRLV